MTRVFADSSILIAGVGLQALRPYHVSRLCVSPVGFNRDVRFSSTRLSKCDRVSSPIQKAKD